MEAVSGGRPRKRADPSTITLAISKEDKRIVKTYAAEREVTVSDLLHQWIQDFCVKGRDLDGQAVR